MIPTTPGSRESNWQSKQGLIVTETKTGTLSRSVTTVLLENFTKQNVQTEGDDLTRELSSNIENKNIRIVDNFIDRWISTSERPKDWEVSGIWTWLCQKQSVNLNLF